MRSCILSSWVRLPAGVCPIGHSFWSYFSNFPRRWLPNPALYEASQAAPAHLIAPDETPTTTHRLRGRPPQVQPVEGGGGAAHLAARPEPADPPARRRARGADLRAQRQALHRTHGAGTRGAVDFPAHPRGHAQSQAAERRVPDRGGGFADHRDDPYSGALRPAAGDPALHETLSTGASVAAPGQPDADRGADLERPGRLRHRHRGLGAVRAAGDAAVLRVEPLRGRAARIIRC